MKYLTSIFQTVTYYIFSFYYTYREYKEEDDEKIQILETKLLKTSPFRVHSSYEQFIEIPTRFTNWNQIEEYLASICQSIYKDDILMIRYLYQGQQYYICFHYPQEITFEFGTKINPLLIEATYKNEDIYHKVHMWMGPYRNFYHETCIFIPKKVITLEDHNDPIYLYDDECKEYVFHHDKPLFFHEKNDEK